jgi:hypothetical protein
MNEVTGQENYVIWTHIGVCKCQAHEKKTFDSMICQNYATPHVRGDNVYPWFERQQNIFCKLKVRR